MGKTKIRRIVIFVAFAVIAGLVVLISRGTYVSNSLKRLILPELTAATGRQVVAQKIYINIFPLFVEAKDMKVFDEGNEILRVPRIKGYVEIPALFRKRLVLRRLVVKEPDIRTDSSQLKDIVGNVTRYLEMERKTPFKVVVKAVVVDKGKFTFAYGENSFRGSGLSGETVLNTGENFIGSRQALTRANFTLKEMTSTVKGWPEFKSEIKGAFVVRNDAVEVKGLQIGFYGSMINTGGTLFIKGDSGKEKSEEEVRGSSKSRDSSPGSLHIRMGLLAESFKKIFGLKQRGDGGISAKGTVHLVRDDLLQSVTELELKGNFYVETLLELLNVKEPVKGLVDFTGAIKGPLNRLSGNAKARLKNGNLYDIQVDDLRCLVNYSDDRLDFREGKAVLYNGRADAEAVFSVAGDGYYSLNVKFAEVDSPAVLALIGWTPDIPLGKVTGGLRTSGTEFNPTGSFSYESTRAGKDFLGRVKTIKGAFVLQGDRITLSESVLSTERSSIIFSGNVDIDVRRLSIAAQLKTSDLTDLTIPYHHELAGSGEFSGTIAGTFDNPSISGKGRFRSVSYYGYGLGEAAARLDYRKDLLELKDFSAQAGARPEDAGILMMKGEIRFPESKELFDLKKPLYNLSLTMKNGDLERFVRSFYKKAGLQAPSGRFDAVTTITGTEPKPIYRGTARISGGRLGKVGIDSASFGFFYDHEKFLVEDALAKKGDSTLTANGSISHDDKFTFKVSSAKIYLKDFMPTEGLPRDAYVSFRSEGNGTTEDPKGELIGTVHGGRFRDADLGEGKVNAFVKEKTLFLNLTLFDDKVALSGNMSLKGELPWTARLDVRHGRYDFLATPWVKDIPDDFLFNMRGSADMSGNRSHFSARAVINQISTTFYGNNFSNDSDIRFEMRDRRLILSAMKLRSGSASFMVSGEMEIGKDYNLVMEGSSSLAPLKGFFKKIDTIRGDAGFVFSVSGKWSDPRIDGGVNVVNAVFGMKDFPYRISYINGYLYMDGNRIIIEKLSGKLGGGDTDISGVAHLQGFTLRRFYVNATMRNIGISISKDFTANLGGTVVYTGTVDSQTLNGEIRINRALYREPVEWQSWLLKAKARERPRGEIGVFEKTNLNVRVQGADNVLINNNIARASLDVNMVLRGTVAAPVIVGRVTTKSGIVYFRNNEFRILGGSADFADPRRINPTMNIAAETTIQGYTIRMALEGQIDQFTMALSSTPSLEEIEILSLLTVGTLAKEPKGIQGGISTNAATSFLSGQIQNIAQERLRSITGIDRIGVEPSVSKVTGKSEQRLTVSKRLMGDRLSVTYSTALGSVATDVIRMEYNIGNNIALIGERDEAGAFGGSIKFRFGFK